MTTDRELLEWAAKAHGGLEYVADCDAWIHVERGAWWNPLVDDGDALRLAVKLKLVVHVWDDGENVSVAKTLPCGDDPDDGDAWHCVDQHTCGGIEAATRRAIIRAAASIGQQMEK